VREGWESQREERLSSSSLSSSLRSKTQRPGRGRSSSKEPIGKERRSEEKASPEKRRPEAQALRERRAAGAEERAAASEREREAIIKEEERAKGAAKGAASLAEEAKLIFFPKSATGKEATMAKEKKNPGRSKERSMERRSEGGRLSPLEAMMPEKEEKARGLPCNIDKT
jgi:hypothetical protein